MKFIKLNLKYTIVLSVGLSLTWLVTTMFIDFAAVPSVFSTVTSRDDAAALGITIFKKFNYVEIVVGILLILFTRRKIKIFSTFLVLIPLLYTLYLSPAITKFNSQKANLIEEDPKMEKVQESLDFYHNFYVRLDSVKIILLLILLRMQFVELKKIQIKEENV